jgi:hypothetical protein
VHHFDRTRSGQCRVDRSAACLGRHQHQLRTQTLAWAKQRVLNRFGEMSRAVPVELGVANKSLVDSRPQSVEIHGVRFIGSGKRHRHFNGLGIRTTRARAWQPQCLILK